MCIRTHRRLGTCTSTARAKTKTARRYVHESARQAKTEPHEIRRACLQTAQSYGTSKSTCEVRTYEDGALEAPRGLGAPMKTARQREDGEGTSVPSLGVDTYLCAVLLSAR
jgi:hypothetical protein